jgi:hypothetical protein
MAKQASGALTAGKSHINTAQCWTKKKNVYPVEDKPQQPEQGNQKSGS